MRILLIDVCTQDSTKHREEESEAEDHDGSLNAFEGRFKEMLWTYSDGRITQKSKSSLGGIRSRIAEDLEH